MANLCCNTVYLIGEKSKLDKIVDAYNHINTPCKTLEALQENLQFTCENWGRSYDCGISSLDFDDKNRLVIDCCTAWGSVDDYWNALANFLALDSWASWSELDSEIFVVNDNSGNIFPTQYILEIWEDNEYKISDERQEFNSEDEALTYLNDHIGKAATIEEYSDLIDDEGWGNLITVERC